MKTNIPFAISMAILFGSIIPVHATSGVSASFSVDTRNFGGSPTFAVETRAPDLIANTGITDPGGTSFTITMAMLQVTGGADGLDTITFTVIAGPVHGVLRRDGISLTSGELFTQADVDAGLVVYERDAGAALTDTLEVDAIDDNDVGLLGGSFTFAVSGIPGASGGLTLVDTRNYTESTEHSLHTDTRTYVSADTSPGSLRQAIANTDPGETVDFDAGLSGVTIILGGTELTVGNELTIDASMLASGISISGDGASRVLRVSQGSGAVLLDSLAITGGSEFLGGGIYVDPGNSVTLLDCTLTGNTASGGGGALFSLSAAPMTAVIDLINSTVTGNSAINGPGGGLYTDGSTIRLNHTTIVDNSAKYVAGGLASINGSSLVLENSIVANNLAPLDSGH